VFQPEDHVAELFLVVDVIVVHVQKLHDQHQKKVLPLCMTGLFLVF
jgi:hypothetical protein